MQALADPLADNILTSVVNNDFTLYTKNFDDVMLKVSTQSNFDSMVSSLKNNWALTNRACPVKPISSNRMGRNITWSSIR